MTLDRVSTTAETVRDVEAETQERATMSRAQFHRAIQDAHQAGHSYRAIAQAAGISHQRVSQILSKQR